MTKCIDLYIAAARSSTHKAGGFAAISVQENGEKTEYSGGRGTVSIYRLQLEALWSSLKEEKGAAKIRLHTDDAFIIKNVCPVRTVSFVRQNRTVKDHQTAATYDCALMV